MTIEKTAQKINNSVKKWAKNRKKLIVGIDGYSGVGKTTLLKRLTKINRKIKPLYIDDFILPIKHREKLLSKAKDKSEVFELKWNDLKKIRRIIARFKKSKNGQVLVMEGIFLFHPKVLDDVWDKKIYLDTDHKLADKRRVKREKAKAGKDYIPETHPDSFARLFKIAHQRYRKLYKPKSKADLIVRI